VKEIERIGTGATIKIYWVFYDAFSNTEKYIIYKKVAWSNVSLVDHPPEKLLSKFLETWPLHWIIIQAGKDQTTEPPGQHVEGRHVRSGMASDSTFHYEHSKSEHIRLLQLFESHCYSLFVVF